MDIFTFRDSLIDDYASYVQSFIQIRTPLLQLYVQEQLKQGVLWPNPLIQLSPLFESGASIDALVAEGVLHPECTRIFRVGKTADGLQGRSLQPHKHQDEAIRIAASGASYVLTTGTGSGKSLTYMIPLIDAILWDGTKYTGPRNLNTEEGRNKIYSRHDEKTTRAELDHITFVAYTRQPL